LAALEQVAQALRERLRHNACAPGALVTGTRTSLAAADSHQGHGERWPIHQRTGTTRVLELSSEDTVAMVKERVPGSERLVFGGMDLPDHATLAECGVPQDSTIDAQPRCRGGAPTAAGDAAADNAEHLGHGADSEAVQTNAVFCIVLAMAKMPSGAALCQSSLVVRSSML
jgi:hypothetical protein